MPRPLKVFRTVTGFHDAYVAVPCRAAALRAWGAAKDLFARGVAEEVTEPALAAEALARPGVVIRRPRGALVAPPPPPHRTPPSRAVLDRAEAAIREF